MFIRLNRKGFTLVELMIVVAIIGLLAAIAIPNLLRARLNSQRGAMITNTRAFSTANESYRAAQVPVSYAANIAALTANPQPGGGPPYLDSTWQDGGVKSGFVTNYTPGAPQPPLGIQTYALTADGPAAGAGQADIFCVDQQGVVTSGGAGGGVGCPPGNVPIDG